MAQERIVTPEKQLLNLIETGSAKNAGIHAHAVVRKGISLFSPGAWAGRISFLKDKLKKIYGGGYLHLDIKLINAALVIFVSALAIYFFVSIFLGVSSLKKRPVLEVDARSEGEDTASLQSVSILKDTMAYYMGKINQRDIFKMGATPGPIQGGVSKELTPRIIEETQRFKLVGISWSKNPDAMIEDTVALRTFFLKRGQMLGRVKIEAIFKDKVILGFEGEEVELR